MFAVGILLVVGTVLWGTSVSKSDGAYEYVSLENTTPIVALQDSISSYRFLSSDSDHYYYMIRDDNGEYSVKNINSSYAQIFETEDESEARVEKWNAKTTGSFVYAERDYKADMEGK